MDNKIIAGAVVGVGLIGATMFGAGTMIGGDSIGSDAILEKIDSTSVKETRTIETVYDTSEVGKEIQNLQNRKEMNLIKITKIQEDNVKIDELISEKTKILNVK